MIFDLVYWLSIRLPKRISLIRRTPDALGTLQGRHP
jgi:hypothetical protein